MSLLERVSVNSAHLSWQRSAWTMPGRSLHLPPPPPPRAVVRQSLVVSRALATRAATRGRSKSVVKEADDGDLKESLQSMADEINATCGKNSVIVLGASAVTPVETFSSGSLLLDSVLGGGYPRGRIVEVYGPESSGKTTLALHAIKAVQNAGEAALFIDAEHAFNEGYAVKLGIDRNRLLICQPDYGEQAMEIADQTLRSGKIRLIVVDSVSALIPKAELEAEMGQQSIGVVARMMSSGLRKLASSAQQSGSTVIFINQIRMKIGVLFGNPETTSGGNALKFYASQRLEIRQSSKLKNGDDDVGIKAKVKVVKSKVSKPFGVAEIDIIFNEGICYWTSVVDAGEKFKLIERKGAWYSYQDAKLGQGKEKAVQYLKDNPDLAEEIVVAIRESTRALHFGDKKEAAVVAAASDFDLGEVGDETHDEFVDGELEDLAEVAK